MILNAPTRLCFFRLPSPHLEELASHPTKFYKKNSTHLLKVSLLKVISLYGRETLATNNLLAKY